MRVLTQSRRILVASGLLLGLAAAHADGFTVTPAQEAMVKVGMSTAEVQAALGQPSHIVKYDNEPGPTWTYTVAGAPDENAIFHVDFAADGRVASVDVQNLWAANGTH